MNKSTSIIPGKQEKVAITRGKIDSLCVYDVTEDELEELAKGGSDPIFLNFAIFTLSIGVSFLITLLTTTIESQRLFNIFLIITILGFLSGVILFIIWLKTKNSTRNLVKKIKARIKEER